MNKFGIFLLAVGCSTLLWAKPLTQAEFKAEVKRQYNEIENKQAILSRALDEKEHPTSLVRKACDYSISLKTLKQFSKNNLHLAEAKDELKFMTELDQHFDQSLADLGATFDKDCKKS